MDEKTGLITGIAPGVIGQYVITACAYEYRKGKLINIHRKDIHVAVSDCIPLNALLKPDYAFCDDLNVTFRNEQINPSGSKYIWDFGDGNKPDTSSDAEGKVTHAYADSGIYKVRLKVILANGQCLDSTTTNAKVYPGFFAGFTSTGSCILNPIQFADTTRSRYGTVISWRWDFGDEASLADSSRNNFASWKYATTGIKKVKLTVESSKGCVKTVSSDVEVRDKPAILLPFRDTLICNIDTLQLQALGNGQFSWTPGYNILADNTSQPLVFPKITTWYKISLNENGCINKDSIQVRVADSVTLDAGRDTLICANDPVKLNPQTDGLQYQWTPALYLNNNTLKNPIATPPVTTTYTIRSIIGKCYAEDDVSITAIPYPLANAGNDTTICFEDTAQLYGSMDGTQFKWTPVNTLLNSNTLNPQAFPLRTTAYYLYAYDVKGCPKPGIDTVIVTVRPKINAFAGNDTTIVSGQPLQLKGSGAPLIQWTPPRFLNDPDRSDPIATLNDNITYTMRAYYPDGCAALDTIHIRVFKTAPDIFVPNAFVPGGKNRLLRPIPVGMARIEYFRVYNRWGQLVFQTSASGHGWDGNLGGQPQPSGTYAWIAQGTDYTGKIVLRKGTAVLIR
jgi:gliding motility-associated-like protein